MIFYKNRKWNMCAEKIHYMQNEKEITQYVGGEGHNWWVDFVDRWKHTKIIEFIPVEPTKEQLDRLEEINNLNIPDGFGSMLSDYVECGVFPEGFNHPLRSIQIAKENELLKQELEKEKATNKVNMLGIIEVNNRLRELEG